MSITNNYTHHSPPPCDEPLGVLYVDEDIVVVNKPAGLLSVPGRLMKDCVVARLQVDFRGIRIVHRLDLDTSGLMVLGLTQRAVSDLNRQFRERLVTKIYTAEVFGHLALAAGEINWPIDHDPVHRPRMRVDVLTGKAAMTHYKVLAQAEEYARVQLSPITGRSHQLRLHLAHLGHPILGCDLYAHQQAFEAAPRLMLHATQLSFLHPATGARRQFEAPAPF
jgi:tRNA pseudouridine32 synthase/23S rRNA pseudouridine746 synthase